MHSSDSALLSTLSTDDILWYLSPPIKCWREPFDPIFARRHFLHLLLDGYSGDPGKMHDRDLLLSFLNEYPVTLGMKKICEPTVLRYDASKPEDSGLSGFVMIAESHISVHTFPHRNYINIDIFSCNSFDAKKATKDIENIFSLRHAKTWVIDRGLEHYDSQLATQEQVAGVGEI